MIEEDCVDVYDEYDEVCCLCQFLCQIDVYIVVCFVEEYYCYVVDVGGIGYIEVILKKEVQDVQQDG